jgi:hypothetical protein
MVKYSWKIAKIVFDKHELASGIFSDKAPCPMSRFRPPLDSKKTELIKSNKLLYLIVLNLSSISFIVYECF